MKNDLTSTVKRYIGSVWNDKTHRFKSWDNCFDVFNDPESKENRGLHLAFYLASWGMYRGSSGLLQKNHLIHDRAVEILYKTEHQKLKYDSVKTITKENIKGILRLKLELSDYYKNIPYSKGTGEPKSISPTDTLLSKIMLGTLGCVPAYDRYFIDGLKEEGFKNFKFDEASLVELFDFINDNKDEIENLKTEINYPTMKILDMYFWQIGYDKEVREKPQTK